MDTVELQRGFENLLMAIDSQPQRVTEVELLPEGEQGASGSQVRYYTVTSEDASGNIAKQVMVTKAATLLERRIMHHLTAQQCAVPPVYIPDVSSEGQLPIYMPFLDECPSLADNHPDRPLTRSAADGLAGIHARNRKNPPPWLPHASDDFLRRLWLYAWREEWEKNLKDAEFAAEFGRCTEPLNSAMEQFMHTLEALTAEGDTLTLLNVDLTPAHPRLWRGEIRFIDWQQSAYGTLYLDLPNHFTVETALTYRDALARHGYEIPVLDFMERYREVGRYMGLRYLGFSLWQWGQGGEERQRGRWFLYYTLTLALRGR